MHTTDYLPKDLFEGKTVFVTGGGSGINLGIGKTFATLGANVAICGRKKERLDAASQELRALGATVVAEVADVRQYEALQAAMAKCNAVLGPIDVLVCGAAGNFPIPAEKLSPNGFKSVVDIDLLGSFNSCRAAFEQLSTTRGCIIFISAGMSFLPYPYQVHVGAAKAGVDNLMKNLALEWGKYGIRSNSIVPGPIEGTEGVKRLGGEAWAATQQNSIPLGRFGTLDDIARAAVFLASPLASYVTGTVLVVDGGQNLAGSASFASAIEAMQAQQQQ
ncbi:MAG TPA: SDR family oxidoreductase [Burkholderiales bacterium]|nr:SDR family oxidoreductase [Burkholderiales bacterium]